MIVWENGKISPEFILGSATSNMRASLKMLFPDLNIKGVSREQILSCIDIDGMVIDPDGLRSALWDLMGSELTGSYHIMELADSELATRDRCEILDRVYASVRTSRSEVRIETNQAIDARIRHADNQEDVLDVLYLGEAEAEIADHLYDYVDPDKGVRFKAYRVFRIPVLSRITIGTSTLRPSLSRARFTGGLRPKQRWTSFSSG